MSDTASGSTGSPGGRAEEQAELLEAGLERGLGAHQRVLGLGGLELGAEDVELAREPDLEARLGGLQQALAALQALPRDGEELPLRDHVVEGARDLDGQALAAELVGALLGLPGPAAVREVVVGRVGPGAAQQRLPHEEGRRGASGDRVAAVSLEVKAATPRGCRPSREASGTTSSPKEVPSGLGEAGRQLRAGTGPGRRPPESPQRPRVRLIEEAEVALEGQAHGRGQAQGRAPGRRPSGLLVRGLVGSGLEGRGLAAREGRRAAPGLRRDRRRTTAKRPMARSPADRVPPVGRD